MTYLRQRHQAATTWVPIPPYSDSCGQHCAWLSENTETTPLIFVGSSELLAVPLIADARSGPTRQLPEPVKRIWNIEAKATPK